MCQTDAVTIEETDDGRETYELTRKVQCQTRKMGWAAFKATGYRASLTKNASDKAPPDEPASGVPPKAAYYCW